MKKKATIVDIALKLGITPSTVSKAFSNHPRISAETKDAVFLVAKNLGYQPNSLATGLRKGKSGLVGVLVPAIHYSFFATAIKGAEEELSKEGYNVIIAQSKDNADFEKKQLEGLLRAQVEGIIASIGADTTDFGFYKTLAASTPLVLFDRTYEDDSVSTVTVDDYLGAVAAVDHLVEMGYKRIAHLAGYQHVLPFARRIEGYKSALKKHGLPFREEYLFQCAPNKDEGSAVMEKLLDLPEPPDAIFAASDYLAFGAIKAIRQRGLRIPENIGIVGFSNEEFSSQVSPAMTTVDQFSEKIGSMSAKLLIDQLTHGVSAKEFAIQRQVLVPKLIVRQSSLRMMNAPLPRLIL